MSSTDRLLQMVSERNHPTYPLTPEKVSLDGLLVEQSSDYNTRVTMRARGSGSGYTGQVDLFYTRVNMTALGTIELTREERFTLEELLGTINVLKKAQMTPDDLTNTGAPTTATGAITTFTLSAKDTSLVWLGNTRVTILNGIPASAPSLLDFLTNHAAEMFPQN